MIIPFGTICIDACNQIFNLKMWLRCACNLLPALNVQFEKYLAWNVLIFFKLHSKFLLTTNSDYSTSWNYENIRLINFTIYPAHLLHVKLIYIAWTDSVAYQFRFDTIITKIMLVVTTIHHSLFIQEFDHEWFYCTIFWIECLKINTKQSWLKHIMSRRLLQQGSTIPEIS